MHRLCAQTPLLLLATLLSLLSPPCALAQDTAVDEYDIRAAMVMDIAAYVHWPNWKFGPSQLHFVVCIVGPDPIGPELEHYAQRTVVASRPVEIRKLTDLTGLNSCHMLYASRRAGCSLIQHHTAELQEAGVLTISERPNLENPDQIIGLPVHDERIRININVSAAQRAGVSFSSRLLRLASISGE